MRRSANWATKAVAENVSWVLVYITKIHIDYNYKFYFFQTYAKFVMEVEGMPRYIAEEMLFNWTEQLPKLLMQLRKKRSFAFFFLTFNIKLYSIIF